MSKRPLAVLGAVTLTVGLLAGCGGESAKESAITPQPVSRQTLQDILSVNGELRREKTQTINAPTDGRVSEMNVDDGQEVNVGDVPFALDGRAAVAVPGDFSFFRTLDVGSDGPDVLQLERILAADGFSPGRVDRTYTEQTRSALARWQNKYGYGGAKPETDETVQIAITGNSAGYRTGRRGSAVATILSTASSVSTDASTRVGPIAPARRGRVQASLAAYRRVGTPEKPIIEIATSTPTVQENPGGDTACWTVTADVAPSRNTVIPLQIQGDAGGADSARDGDYKTLEGDVTILAGQSSQQFCTEIFDDRIVEEDEEITVVLQVQFGNDPNFVVGPTDRATVTIEDDDTGTPVITISADSAKVNEGQGATFRLTSTLELNRGLDIFVTLGGSMTVEDDYRPLAEDYVTLGAGQTETTFTITPRTDDDVEPDEILTATIIPDPDINPQPYQIGSPSQAAITVESGDVPELNISGGGSVREGGTTTFTITANQPMVEDTTINFQVGGSPAQATITVESGDVPELNISGGGSVREGGTTTFTITANQPMVEDTTINFQVGGSATPGQDYQVLSGIVIMRAGTSSVTIPMRTFSDDVIFYPSDMIVANWPARVGTVAVDAGEFVLQGSPVLDLTEPAISVKLKLSGTERAKIELGMEAQIQLEAGGTQYPGIITALDDSATVGSDKSEVYEGIVSATGDLPNVDGASVSIDITLAERKNVLAVPIAAVLKSGSGNFVRVVTDEGRLKRVEVELGLAQDEYVEITEGLEGDELVVVSVTSAGQ